MRGGSPGAFGSGAVTSQVHAEAAIRVTVAAPYPQVVRPRAVRTAQVQDSGFLQDARGRLPRTASFAGATAHGAAGAGAAPCTAPEALCPDARCRAPPRAAILGAGKHR